MPSGNNKRGSKVFPYQYPRSCPRSKEYEVSVNGEPIVVYQTSTAAFACVSFEGRVAVEVKTKFPVSKAQIRPLARGIQAAVDGCAVEFYLERPMCLFIDIEGGDALYFFGNPPELDAPSPDDANVRYFKAGQIYEVGELKLGNDEILYIEGGAIVRGCIRSTGAKNVGIRGFGILDGSFTEGLSNFRRLALFEQCEDVTVQDVILIEPLSWMLVLGACRGVRVSNIKEIGKVVGSDGVDIVGSRDVLVEACFIANNDDCVAIKSIFFDKQRFPGRTDWGGDVENVLVRACVFLNGQAGNAMEIGHELRTDSISNITFRDCDVLSVHGFGAVFSIHNADRAVISGVLYEDIRIEHCFDRFIDFRVMRSRWGRDERRGRIRDIRLKNIHWRRTVFNEGYTLSLISGFNADHTVENVIIEDLYIDGQKTTNPDDIALYTKYAKGIVMK
ncbi:MAG: glycosyl hydrolase family 28 protein [Bacillota bacterium]